MWRRYGRRLGMGLRYVKYTPDLILAVFHPRLLIIVRMQNKTLDAVKGGSKASSAQTSRAVSVSSNGTPAAKGKGKGRKK